MHDLSGTRICAWLHDTCKAYPTNAYVQVLAKCKLYMDSLCILFIRCSRMHMHSYHTMLYSSWMHSGSSRQIGDNLIYGFSEVDTFEARKKKKWRIQWLNSHRILRRARHIITMIWKIQFYSMSFKAFPAEVWKISNEKAQYRLSKNSCPLHNAWQWKKMYSINVIISWYYFVLLCVGAITKSYIIIRTLRSTQRAFGATTY